VTGLALRRVLLAAVASASLSSSHASFPPPAPRPTQTPVPWKVGERLGYRLKFGLFNVGHAELSVLGIDTIRGTPCYHVLFTIRGHALTYTLQDSLQSWFGVEDLVSRRFWQNSLENGHPRVRHYEIMPEHHLWIYNDTDSGVTVEEPLDDASFFFFARTLSFENGRQYSLARYFRSETNPVTIRVLGHEGGTSVPAGRFPTWVVRPTFKSGGLFGERGAAAIWFSDDQDRLPVRIRASLGIGTIDLSLTSRE
jgi:hypothetical protein